MKYFMRTIFYILIFLPVLSNAQTCASLSNCSGHGTCNPSTDVCSCFEGWGAANDLAYYKSPDCSLRTCPTDKSWGDIPTSSNAAHALAECSNRGICDRSSGTCTCFPGFDGSACQRLKCPNNCSGHGQCLPMSQLAEAENAFPLSAATTYSGSEATTTWDSEMIHGCLCDSSWNVGLGYGQRQKSEWFGPDCSFRRCPSADDPRTHDDESDCEGAISTGGKAVGLVGNICHVDCANRGICDYTTGKCSCFDGYYGEACSLQSALAVYG